MSMRLTPHRFFAANPVGVDWVCGDLHGEFEALQPALSGAGFNEAADRLFLLGDTIDRGPESRALLEWVLGTEFGVNYLVRPSVNQAGRSTVNLCCLFLE